MWIIVRGDFVNGFDFTGPFKSREDAQRFAIDLPGTSHVLRLLEPNYA